MSENENCPVDGDEIVEHESHRDGKPPKVKVAKRINGKLGKLGLSPTAIPGLSLTNYSKNAQGKGWGAPCTGARTTVTVSTGAKVTVRNEIAELVKLIMQECIRRGYHIRPADTGAYNCRKIAGTTTWSNHAWAIAVDINWQTNPYVATLRTDMPSWMPALFNRYGFAWGGDYSGRKDAMHYEFMGTPDQARVATDLARRELGGGGPAPVPAPGPYVGDLHGMTGFSRGSTSPHVQSWQRWYNAYPFSPALLPIISPTSPTFGPQTEDAVRKFQARYGLVVDGVMGKQTIGKSWDLGWRG